MEQEKLWAIFEKSGKIEDYLRYCGIDAYSCGENAVTDTQEGPYERDHRRTDRAGKQQYR